MQDGAVRTLPRYETFVTLFREPASTNVAEARAERLGVPKQAQVRRAFVESLIDAERTLRLEAAGYEVNVVAFVSKAVSGHNLLWRCRYIGEPNHMRASAARLSRLRAVDEDVA